MTGAPYRSSMKRMAIGRPASAPPRPRVNGSGEQRLVLIEGTPAAFDANNSPTSYTMGTAQVLATLDAAPPLLSGGVPLVPGGAIVTAELANLAVDQCELIEDRFTLIAPDNYRSDFLEIKLWSKNGDELARESLYVED